MKKRFLQSLQKAGTPDAVTLLQLKPNTSNQTTLQMIN
jgi:hypothetical protein